jgi:hypothetical protein
VNGSHDNAPWLALVRQQVDKTDFGVVQIVIHESRVVRIERTEKLLVPREDENPNERRNP